MGKVASTILMIRPASFGFNAQTAENNVFQSSIASLSPKEIQQNALEEFDAFVDILREKNIDVIVLQDEPEPTRPDAIFPNNWFCTLGDGTVTIFPMFAPNRRIEKRDDLLQMLKDKYDVKGMEDWSEYENQDLFLEGTGSMIIDHQNKLIYACLSPRTHTAVLEKFAQAHGYRALTFHAKDENGVDIYHTNVIMHLGEDYAVICLESIPDETEKSALSGLLIATGHEIMPITLQQVHAYAGNMLQVKNRHGEKFTLLSRQAYDSLTKEQIDKLQIHTQLLPIDISTIETVGGGSVRCMVAEIFLEKKELKLKIPR